MNTPTQDPVSEGDMPTATPVQIQILDSYGNVDQPQAPLSKKNHDTVVWYNNSGDTAYIVFHTKKHSPLDDEVMVIEAGKASPVEKIKGSAQDDGTPYEYAVLGADGVNDPTVIINK